MLYETRLYASFQEDILIYSCVGLFLKEKKLESHYLCNFMFKKILTIFGNVFIFIFSQGRKLYMDMYFLNDNFSFI